MLPDTPVSARSWRLLFSAWLVAMAATLGSLFFSEVMELVPCVLCWYQRIFMFPLAVVLLAGLVASDRNVVRYAMPLAAIGLLVTLYHCLVFFGLIPENMRPCAQGVSCSDEGMVLAGFLPIPLLSLAAFLIIFVLLLTFQSRKLS